MITLFRICSLCTGWR